MRCGGAQNWEWCVGRSPAAAMLPMTSCVGGSWRLRSPLAGCSFMFLSLLHDHVITPRGYGVRSKVPRSADAAAHARP